MHDEQTAERLVDVGRLTRAMLATFLVTHRAELIARTRKKVEARSSQPPAMAPYLENGLPLFLDQLGDALQVPSTSGAEIVRTAGLHGRELLKHGFTIEQVVRDYGDVCQAVTELALETDTSITVDEFQTLNRCLDDATAEAVSQYTVQRDRSVADSSAHRLGTVVHELRGRLSTAMMAFSLLEEGRIGIGGSTGAILKRSLSTMGTMLDRSFAEVRLASGLVHREPVVVSELVEQIQVDGAMEAESRGLVLVCAAGEPGLCVTVDRLLIAAALGNLMQNAFKFTPRGGHVTLRTSTTPDVVRFEVADECGGLPPGKSEDLFIAYQQRGSDRTGLGLGLDIARRSVEACGGSLQARDVPGHGCVFTMQLPRT